jgi:aldose 1-epimerase
LSYKNNEMIIKSQNISRREWGEYLGHKIYLYKIENATGAYIELTNYGARLVSAVVPDKAGNFENVVLGYSSLAGYIADECYLGATIGRFANRIARGLFTLDGVTYQLDVNDGNHANHGGYAGFNTRVFDCALTDNGISFSLQSNDGDGGFPGNLELVVTYAWTDDNELKISYKSTVDQKTIANFTNHAYFNLSAKGGGIFDHNLKVHADKMLEVDAAFVPTGLIKVAGNWALNGEVLRDKMIGDNNAIRGYNNCFVLNDDDGSQLKKVALLIDSASGRRAEVLTSYPAVVVYTGGYLKSKAHGNYSRPYRPFDGLSLECQYYPDSPNHAGFPSTELGPGDEYDEIIVYKFGVVA